MIFRMDCSVCAPVFLRLFNFISLAVGPAIDLRLSFALICFSISYCSSSEPSILTNGLVVACIYLCFYTLFIISCLFFKIYFRIILFFYYKRLSFDLYGVTLKRFPKLSFFQLLFFLLLHNRLSRVILLPLLQSRLIAGLIFLSWSLLAIPIRPFKMITTTDFFCLFMILWGLLIDEIFFL